MSGPSVRDVEPFRHPAFFYDSPDAYRGCLVPEVSAAVEVGDAVLIAVPEPNLMTLRTALGAAAEAVTLVDMTENGRNPSAILAGVFSRFAERHRSRPVLMVGEPIWDGRSDLEYPACVQHEALINQAFTGRDITVLCAYDERRLPPARLTDARSTHPVLWRYGRPEAVSADYAPDDAWRRYNQPLTKDHKAVGYTVRATGDLRSAREFAASYGQWFGCSEDRLGDLRLVVTELASEALLHSGGPCRLAFWQQDGYLACEARDDGHLEDPLAGRRLDPLAATRGPGLMMVNAVADLVRCHSHRDGTTVHVFLRVPGRQ